MLEIALLSYEKVIGRTEISMQLEEKKQRSKEWVSNKKLIIKFYTKISLSLLFLNQKCKLKS